MYLWAGSASDIRWHKRKDGTDIFANGVLSAVRGPSGDLRGYTKIISDETARKRLEDSLVQANAALEHFAYAASHDLQEPLRTIGSFAQLLVKQQGDQLSPRGREYLAFITSAVSRMGTLIDDLLAYARAGVEPEPVVAVSLDQEAESAISQLAAAISEDRRHSHPTGSVPSHMPATIMLIGSVARAGFGASTEETMAEVATITVLLPPASACATARTSALRAASRSSVRSPFVRSALRSATTVTACCAFRPKEILILLLAGIGVRHHQGRRRSKLQRRRVPHDDGARIGRRVRTDLSERCPGLLDQQVDDVAGPVLAERAEAP